MLRLVFVAVFLILYLILGIPVLCAEWLIAKRFPYAADISQLRMVQWGFKCILALAGVKLTVSGEEHIPKDTAVLYIGNHRSFFDIVITYSRCPGLTGYVAKDSMLRVPLLSIWMKRLYCLFLDRSNPKEGLKSILTAIDHVKNGISVCIFPEGTRNDGKELSMLPFHSGSFKIAEKTGCAIVPVSLNNTHFMFEQHIPRIEKTHVVIEYGKPIYPKELDKETRKRIAPYCQKIIQDTINRNHSLV